MKILGIEIDYNDADDIERFEKAKEEVKQKLENMSEKGKTNAEIIRESCGYIFNFFDEVLGQGVHKKIFGTKCNIEKCMDAFIDFTEEIIKQSNKIDEKIENFQAKYSPNRATRRSKK